MGRRRETRGTEKQKNSWKTGKRGTRKQRNGEQREQGKREEQGKGGKRGTDVTGE